MTALENLLAPQVTERIGWTLVHFVWQAAAVALLLAVVLRLLRKRSASTRYIVSCLALGLIVAMPMVTIPYIEVAGPIAEVGPAPLAPAAEPAPVEVIEVAELPPESFEAIPPAPANAAVRASWTQHAAETLEPALPYLVCGWLLGVFGLSTWHLGGWTQLQRMKRRMVREVAAPLHAKLAQLAQRLGIRHAVGLLESTLVEVPTVVGWIKPVILLPASVLSGLSPAQLEAILAHELGHIRRYDYLVNMIQTVVEILGFYHPAVWWVSHRIRDERENCCDDLAVRICGDSVGYARALTCLEEMRHRRPELAVAANGGSLVGRIARLLGRPAQTSHRFAWLPGLITLLLVTALLIPTALVLAAPDASPATVSAQVNAEEDPAENGPDRTRVLTNFILADIFTDHVMDRETAEQARAFLKRRPTEETGGRSGRRHSGTMAAPSIQELQRPLSEVLASTSVNMGQAEDFLSFLVSQGHAKIIARPKLLQFAGERGTIAYGHMEEPNSSALNVDVRPFVHVHGSISLRIDFTQRSPILFRENDSSPATVSMQHTLLMDDGQDALLTTEDELRDEDGNKYLSVLLVRPEIVFSPDRDKPAQTTAVVASGQETQDEAGQKGEPVLIATICVKLNGNRELDRETIERLAEILSADDQIGPLAPMPSARLSDVLRTCVVGQNLASTTVETLLEMLQSRGYLEVTSRPQVMVHNNSQAAIQINDSEHFWMDKDPSASPQRVTTGTSFKVTPHVPRQARDRVRLEIEARHAALAAPPQDDTLPTICTMEMASTVTMRWDRYVSFLLEPDNAAQAQITDDPCRLIMLQAIRTDDAASQPAESSGAQVQQSVKSPRQVLLDIRVMEIDPGELANVGIEWSFPRIGGTFGSATSSDGRGWPSGTQIGFTPDEMATKTLWTRLHRLNQEQRTAILSQPRIVTLEDRASYVKIGDQRHFPMPESLQTPGTTEQVGVNAGISLSITPHVSANNDITLDMDTQVSERRPAKQDGELPAVERRIARNVVTVKNGATVALAGLGERNVDTQKQCVVLVTASLAPETTSVAPSQDTAAPLPTATPNTRARERANAERMREILREELARTEEEIRETQAAWFPGDEAERARRLEKLGQLKSTVEQLYAGITRILEEEAAAPEEGETEPLPWTAGAPAWPPDSRTGPPLPDTGHLEYESLVRSDPVIGELQESIAKAERDLVVMQQTMLPEHPEIVAKRRLLEAFQEKAEQRRLELEQEFERIISDPGRDVDGRDTSERQFVRRDLDGEEKSSSTAIRMDFTVLDVAAGATLDRETSAQLSGFLSGVDTDTVRLDAGHLRRYRVGPLLEMLHRVTPAASFQKAVDLLVSKGYLDIVTRPTLEARAGQQAKIAVGPDEMTLAVVAETRDNGRTVRMDVNLDLNLREPSTDSTGPNAPASVRSVRSQVTLEADDQGYALQSLAGLASVAEDARVFYLLVHPQIVPIETPATPAAPSVETNLTSVLTEIATQTGTRIAVDKTVRPIPVRATTDGLSVTSALSRVLEGTPYAFRESSEHTFLVYRPITGSFQGEDLREALNTMGATASVRIDCDPNVTGEVYADIRNVPLETALDIILAGSPFVVKSTPEGYVVADRTASGSQPSGMKQGTIRVVVRFMQIGTDLRDALQHGLPIKGIASDDDLATLYEIGQAMSQKKWTPLDETRKQLLLKAIQNDAGSRSLASPAVTVRSGESTEMTMNQEMVYTAGYDEPQASGKQPQARSATVKPGMELTITPSLDSEDRITLNGRITLSHLEGFDDRTYRDKYLYQVPRLDVRDISIDSLRVRSDQAALLIGPMLRWPYDPAPDGAACPTLLVFEATQIEDQTTEAPDQPHNPAGMRALPLGAQQLPGGMGGR